MTNRISRGGCIDELMVRGEGCRRVATLARAALEDDARARADAAAGRARASTAVHSLHCYTPCRPFVRQSAVCNALAAAIHAPL